MLKAPMRMLVVGLAAVALAGSAAHAASPSVDFTTEPDALILNAPMIPTVCHGSPTGGEDICATPPIQLNGHIDGTAESEAGVVVVQVDLVGENLGEDQGEATLSCTDETSTVCDWTYFPRSPIPPGTYTVTATVMDTEAATASSTISVTIL